MSDVSSFQSLHEKKSCKEIRLQQRYLHVFREFLTQENYVTPTKVMEMKADITKQIKMTSC